MEAIATWNPHCYSLSGLTTIVKRYDIKLSNKIIRREITKFMDKSTDIIVAWRMGMKQEDIIDDMVRVVFYVDNNFKPICN